MDWFTRAKEAKKKAADNEYGNQGSGSDAYKEAQKALDEAEAQSKDTKDKKQVASDD